MPLLFTFTGPTGTITKDAFDRITAEMISMLEQGAPWDGVLLAQHGAAVSEEHPDMDGEVARLVRQAVGPRTPVVMTLDLHSNITPKQAAHTEAIVAYRTNPHLDAEASEILVRTIRGRVQPVQHLVQVPMIISIVKQPTGFGPMKAIMDDVAEVMSRQQYYFMGIFPEQYKTVICKGTVSPRAAYEPIAREIIMANTPGVTSADVSTFEYVHRRRPLYPFEPDTRFRL